MINKSTEAKPLKASIAAEPVSPDVAPTMVTFSPRRFNATSNIWPINCIATSLNANVGPWNNSNKKWFSESWTIGHFALCEKPAYADLIILLNSSSENVSPTNGFIILNATSS